MVLDTFAFYLKKEKNINKKKFMVYRNERTNDETRSRPMNDRVTSATFGNVRAQSTSRKLSDLRQGA